MNAKKVFLSGLWLLCSTIVVAAQDAQAVAEQQQKERAELEKKAVALLDGVVAEAQGLRLPENRIRVLVNAGELLWKHDEGRARATFTEAASALTALTRGLDLNDRRNFQQLREASQLRQELLTTVARLDPQLAYDFLRSTKPPEPAADGRGLPSETDLETNLLAQVAAADPALALKNALELLDKKQYSSSLLRVLTQLQQKDKEKAAKLSDALLLRLNVETMLADREAGNLALNLLRPGPKPPEAADKPNTAAAAQTGRLLNQTDYVKLLETAINASLRAQPRPPNSGPPRNFSNNGPGNGPNIAPNNPGNPGNRQPSPPAGNPQPPNNRRGGQIQSSNPQANPPANPQETAQNNARNLLSGVQSLLPQIGQYLPARAAQVQQKLTETGQGQAGGGGRQMLGDYGPLLRDGTADALLQTAAGAPPQAQSMLYSQAAMKALNEGNPERARQIANEHLDERQRTPLLQSIERREVTRAAAAGNLEQARQALARLRTNEERVELLMQMAAAARGQNNAKLAVQFLDEANALLGSRAENYRQLEMRAGLARTYFEAEPARGGEVLETGIGQLNELLAAAALLNGFEVGMFKEGELQMLGGGGELSRTITNYGRTLAALARKDFARAEAAADKFQRAEARLFVRLAIAQGVLRTPTIGSEPNPSSFGRFGRQP